MNEWNSSIYRDNSNIGDLSDMSLERMEALESNTNFDFSNTDKVISVSKDIGKEAKKTALIIDNTVSNVVQGITNSSRFFKYLPFLVIAYFSFKLFLQRCKSVI